MTPSDADSNGGEPLDRSLVISYLTLRKVVGFLGVLFPVIMSVGCFLSGNCHGVEDSLSAYYGTDMRNLFVGLLFAIGFFFFSYRGYAREDEYAGKLACAFAVGVALFPTTSAETWVHDGHYGFAVALFLTLAYFSLCLFTKTDADEPTRRKRQRNKVYVTCGVAMIACIVLIVVYMLCLQQTALARHNPVFWLESLMLWAFGISWMTKGEAILKDLPSTP